MRWTNWLRVFACAGVGVVAVGCGGAPAEAGSTSVEGSESLGDVAKALNETVLDRPAATATSIGNENRFYGDMHVFVCNTSHQLMRNIRVDYRGASPSWYGWQRQTNKSCASTPSSMHWRHNLFTTGLPPFTPPNHVANVYWRDDSDQLWELRFKETGGTQTTNLSALLGLGPITGSPAVVDVGDIEGLLRGVTIAIRMRDTNELYTVESGNSAWSVHPVLLFGGTATGIGTFVPAYNLADGSSLFSIQYNQGSHMIYKKLGWGQSYQNVAYTASAASAGPKGVVGIGGQGYPGAEDGCFNGCAMYRGASDNQLRYAPLASGGQLDPIVKHAPAGFQPMGGSIWFNAELPTDLYAYGRGADNHLMHFRWAAWNNASCTDTPIMNSAPFVTDRQVLYAGPSSALIYVDMLHGECGAGVRVISNVGQQLLLP